MNYSMGDLFFLSIQCTHEPLHVGPLGMFVCVVVQFYPLFKFFFPLFWGMVMHSNQLKTKANKNYTKGKTDYFLVYIDLESERLFEAGYLLHFHHFSKCSMFVLQQSNNGSNKT